jgi:uncharacterized phage protein (TIGR02218 family)
MRELSDGMRAALTRAETTLCTCWRIVRRDGASLGFTDHDRDLTVEGVLYAAGSGLEGGAFETALGLAVGGAEASGALSAAALTEDDLANGLYDGARVEIRRVDWSAPANSVLLDVATIGEVRRGERAFVAELRTLAHALDQERGRLYRAQCDADLGDARCGFVFAGEPFVAERAALENCSVYTLRVGLGVVNTGFYEGGRVVVLTGRSAGASAAIRSHRVEAGAHALGLWTPLARPPVAGDRLRVYAGCDKRFETCRDKFANMANFRGFPHMPGNDHVIGYGLRGAGMDGGSLFK